MSEEFPQGLLRQQDTWFVVGKRGRASRAAGHQGAPTLAAETHLPTSTRVRRHTDEERQQTLIEQIDLLVRSYQVGWISEYRRCVRAAAQARLGHGSCLESHAEIHQQEMPCLRVYALGSPATSRAARYQLALALALASIANAGKECLVEAYDPAFTDADRRLLQAYGWEISQASCVAQLLDRQASASVHDCTLIYMPHSPAAVMDTVLSCNMACLDKIVLLGNSLSAIAARKMNQKSASLQPIERIMELVRQDCVFESPFLPAHGLLEAFNDTFCQVFGSLNQKENSKALPYAPNCKTVADVI